MSAARTGKEAKPDSMPYTCWREDKSVRLHSQVSQKIAVFLGPSLPRDQADALLAADYYPPARKGDIYRILPSAVKTILLIDGVFHSTPSVWHREILDAIEEGIQVIGASSMGALRAAELHSFGMLGYGKIFEWYREGVIDGDDEVALLHGGKEVDFCPMSEPLVNIRYTLLKAVEYQYITTEQAKNLIEYAKQLYYPERSYQQLLRSPVLKHWSQKKTEQFEQYLRTHNVNLKMKDAIGLLRHCAAQNNDRQPTYCSDKRQKVHTLWQRERFFLSGFSDSQKLIRGEEVLNKAMQDTALVVDLRTKLSKYYFLLQWARQNSLSCPDAYIKTFIEQWGKAHGIDDEGYWLSASGLTLNSYRCLLSERALINWMTRHRPDVFGLNWNFQTEVQKERLLTGSDEEVIESVQQTQGWHLENRAEEWIDLSERRFLLEWAAQNGVSYPQELLDQHITQWEEAHGIDNRADWLYVRGWTLAYYRDLMAERGLVEWIIRQEPQYFGLFWDFKLALLNELQISGYAAQLTAGMKV
jgi:hypothetical protein